MQGGGFLVDERLDAYGVELASGQQRPHFGARIAAPPHQRQSLLVVGVEVELAAQAVHHFSRICAYCSGLLPLIQDFMAEFAFFKKSS